MGTGKLTQKEERGLGLIGEHDYAVLDLKDHCGKGLLLIKNPWSRGGSWKGNTWCSERLASELARLKVESNKDGFSQPLSPGVFSMSLDDVLQNFQSIYLNWNPGLFKYREDTHFQWNVDDARSPTGCFRANPQYSICIPEGGMVFILLGRHFRSRPQDLTARSTSDAEGFLSLYAFKNDSCRVSTNERVLATSDYIDSPNILLKLELLPDVCYTIVIAEQSLPSLRHAFTLSCLTLSPFSFGQAKDKHIHKYTHHGKWTKSTAGGSVGSALYQINPQYSIKTPTISDVLVTLECSSNALLVQVALIWASGGISQAVTTRDIAGDSGEYRKGFAVAELKDLPAGSYTIVCSTFDRAQLGDFDLYVSATAVCEVKRLPVFGAGQFAADVDTGSFAPAMNRLVLPIMSCRNNRIAVTASSKGYNSCAIRRSTSPLRIAIAFGKGSPMRFLAISNEGEYMDTSNRGTYVHNVIVEPKWCINPGISIVIERLRAADTDQIETVDVLIHSDEPLNVGRWIGDDA